MRTQIDYRDFISSLEKDDSTKEIPFIKRAVLLRQSAKNCCKCNRKQNVQKFKDFVFGADFRAAFRTARDGGRQTLVGGGQTLLLKDEREA